MNSHAITNKKDSYIQLVKTIVSRLFLCLKKKGEHRDVIAPMSELPLGTLPSF